jgi:hypothetical protein
LGFLNKKAPIERFTHLTCSLIICEQVPIIYGLVLTINMTGCFALFPSSIEQKDAFVGFQDDDFNEALLDLHEKELDFLKIYYEEHQRLFQVD